MHEQSVTQGGEGTYFNLYGPKTASPGRPLPKTYPFEQDMYKSLMEAVMAARLRSLLEGQQVLQPDQFDLGLSTALRGK